MGSFSIVSVHVRWEKISKIQTKDGRCGGRLEIMNRSRVKNENEILNPTSPSSHHSSFLLLPSPRDRTSSQAKDRDKETGVMSVASEPDVRSESGKDGPWKELDSRERHGHGTIHWKTPHIQLLPYAPFLRVHHAVRRDGGEVGSSREGEEYRELTKRCHEPPHPTASLTSFVTSVTRRREPSECRA